MEEFMKEGKRIWWREMPLCGELRGKGLGSRGEETRGFGERREGEVCLAEGWVQWRSQLWVRESE